MTSGRLCVIPLSHYSFPQCYLDLAPSAQCAVCSISASTGKANPPLLYFLYGGKIFKIIWMLDRFPVDVPPANTLNVNYK